MKINFWDGKKIACLLATGMLTFVPFNFAKAEEVSTITVQDNRFALDHYDDGLLSFSITEKLQEADYEYINHYLKAYDLKRLLFENISFERIDFTKLDGRYIEELTLDNCRGEIDLEAISLWPHLKKLVLYDTDFINLEKVKKLEDFVLSSYKELSQSPSEILNSLEEGCGKLESLVLVNFPTSQVPFPVSHLTITFPRSYKPDTFTFDAKSLSLIGYNDIALERPYPVPKLVTDHCDNLVLASFDVPLEKLFLEDYKSVELSLCHLDHTIESCASYTNLDLYNVEIGSDSEFVYSTKNEGDEKVYFKDTLDGKNRQELFRVESSKEKVYQKTK